MLLNISFNTFATTVKLEKPCYGLCLSFT